MASPTDNIEGAVNAGAGITAIAEGLFGGSQTQDSSQTQTMNQFVSALQQMEELSQTEMSEEQRTQAEQEVLSSLQESTTSLMDQVVRAQEETTERTQQVSDEALAQQEEFFSGMLQNFSNTMGSDRFSADAATEAASSARDSAVRQVLNEGSSAVQESETNAGAYNSTVRENMGNQLGAQAADAGARTELETRAQFEQQRQNEMQTLLTGIGQAFQNLRGSVTESVGTGSSTQQTEQSEQQQRQQQQREFLESIQNMIGSSSQTSRTEQESSSEQETDQNTETSNERTDSSAGLLKTINPFG